MKKFFIIITNDDTMHYFTAINMDGRIVYSERSPYCWDDNEKDIQISYCMNELGANNEYKIVTI